MCGPKFNVTNDPYAALRQAAAPLTATGSDAKQAAKSLARLMERQLGYSEGQIDPIALRLFIRAYWSRVSAYAHTIHDETA